jgi:putative phosphoribosyl transferase
VVHEDRGGRGGRSEDRPHPAAQEVVRIPVDGVALDGDLAQPPRTGGIVLFAHGSGSSRHSPRNRRVAERLQGDGLGTLLMDLLTGDEEQLDLRSRELRFDIGLLARRLVGAIDWLTARFGGELRVGLFGASTGAAAALVAAAERPKLVAAVVSRGGRPDLAGPALERVTAPTLLIVGGADTQILALNRQAAGRLCAPHRMKVVPWSRPPVRGARRARRGRPPGRRLVRHPPPPDACRPLGGVTGRQGRRQGRLRRACDGQGARAAATGRAGDVAYPLSTAADHQLWTTRC